MGHRQGKLGHARVGVLEEHVCEEGIDTCTQFSHETHDLKEIASASCVDNKTDRGESLKYRLATKLAKLGTSRGARVNRYALDAG